MGRPPNTDERRRQIVAGLRQVLAHKSYAGASTADIAAAAGLATGLVHYHFDSKRAVLLALVQELAQQLRARSAERAQRATDARGRLLAFLDAAVALGPGADEAAAACWISVCAEAVRDQEVRAVIEDATEQVHAELATLVRAALREAGHSGAGARRMATVLWSTVQGSFLLAATAPSVVQRGSMAGLLRALVDNTLKHGGAT